MEISAENNLQANNLPENNLPEHVSLDDLLLNVITIQKEKQLTKPDKKKSKHLQNKPPKIQKPQKIEKKKDSVPDSWEDLD